MKKLPGRGSAWKKRYRNTILSSMRAPFIATYLRYLLAPSGGRCQVAKDLQVLLDLLDDTGSLHLDNDAGAVCEGGRVDLADRGRRQWNVAEAGEYGVNRPAELRRDDVRHDLRLQRASGILQLGELRLIRRREEVGPRREDLAELDEGRTELFEGTPDVLGARQRLLVATVEDALEGDEPLETRDADEEAEAVPREHLADLTVTAGLRLGSDVCQRIRGAPA